jgi:hypothetical protein
MLELADKTVQCWLDLAMLYDTGNSFFGELKGNNRSAFNQRPRPTSKDTN